MPLTRAEIAARALPTVTDPEARVRLRRESLGLTQRDLAKKIGWTQSQISRLESASIRLVDLRHARLASLADALEWTTDSLLGQTEKNL